MSENDAASLCTNDDDRSLLSSAKKQIFDSRLSKKVRNCSKKSFQLKRVSLCHLLFIVSFLPIRRRSLRWRRFAAEMIIKLLMPSFLPSQDLILQRLKSVKFNPNYLWAWVPIPGLGSLTRLFSLPAWPDLATFSLLGQNFKSLGQFQGFFRIW